MNHASAQRGSCLVTFPGDKVHAQCRCNYCRADRPTIQHDNGIPSLQQPTQRTNLRSQQYFNFREHCLFCGQSARTDKNKKQKETFEVYPVRSDDFQENIVQACHFRKDEWSDTVFGRISSVHDLYAAGAIYHKQCSSMFPTFES